MGVAGRDGARSFLQLLIRLSDNLPRAFSAVLPFRDKKDDRCLLGRSCRLILRKMIVLIHCV